MPAKHNAYSEFVDERCRETKTAYPAGFTKFSQEWEEMTTEEKRPYYDRAKRLRDAQYVAEEPPRQQHFHAQAQPAPRAAQVPFGMDAPPAAAPRARVANGFSQSDANKKVSVIVPDVAHGENEITEKNDDIPTPKYSALPECSRLAIPNHYKSLEDMLMQKVFIIGCIPIVTNNSSQTSINRPLEICVESFRVNFGYPNPSQSLHFFISPGKLPNGSRIGVTESRREYHKIPASTTQQTDPEDRKFHASFKLDTSYYDIYSQIVSCVQIEKGVLAPLLTSSDDIGETWACLAWLCDQAAEYAQVNRKPELPMVNVATVEEFCARMYLLKNKISPEEQQRVHKSLRLHRYWNLRELKCPFHQDVDARACARAIACDRLYAVFDILRHEFSLPSKGAHIPPAAGGGGDADVSSVTQGMRRIL